MTPPTPAELRTKAMYELLPMVFRMRDADNGYVLRDLIGLLADQVVVLDEALDQLYDDEFIETCADWVAPYIGDLIGYRPLHGVIPSIASPRAEVANTIHYRRRKGTVAVLEQLARDVTGWPAHAVEFFQLIAATQFMNHIRPQARATPDLRAHEALGWLDNGQPGHASGAFDRFAHTVDVRHIDAPADHLSGRYNLPNVGIFLWRTAAVPLAGTALVPHGTDGRRWRFDPLGRDLPIYGTARSTTAGDHLTTPFDVPVPLRRRWLADHLADYYGPAGSLVLFHGTIETPEYDDAGIIRICDLSDVPGAVDTWAHEPAATDIAIDPVLGRIWFGTAPADSVYADYGYGAAVPVGAGGWFALPPDWPAATQQVTIPNPPPATPLLQPLLNGLTDGGVLLVADNGYYPETPTITTAAPAGPVAEPPSVTVTAATGVRPLIRCAGPLRLAPADGTTIVLQGLVIAGGPVVVNPLGLGTGATIVLKSCTLVPGQDRTSAGAPTRPARASLIVLEPTITVEIDSCILGPIVAVEDAVINVTDSVIDAGDPEAIAFCGRATNSAVTASAGQNIGDGMTAGAALRLDATTVIGGLHAQSLHISNSIVHAALPAGSPWLSPVWASRRQLGCLRYSYVPLDSRAGRRYRCQPDPDASVEEQLAVEPFFSSLRFGDAEYVQLDRATPDEIRRGADDGAEMGVTHSLYTPQREDNLRLRLDEYLRFGLEAGFTYAT